MRTSCPTDVKQIHGAELKPNLWEVSWRGPKGEVWSGQGETFEEAFANARRSHAAAKQGSVWGPPEDGAS